MNPWHPLVVGLGGGMRANSSTERFLRLALSAAESAGASTILLGAEALRLPMYEPGAVLDGPGRHLVEALRRADGIIPAAMLGPTSQTARWAACLSPPAGRRR